VLVAMAIATSTPICSGANFRKRVIGGGPEHARRITVAMIARDCVAARWCIPEDRA